ncbi:unnamed protein product [Allacma fusca]|uniref:Uncharacterized protein n=1 Tax=Allacma fusca TaxID=39272 RepID=A0A8J2KLF2_9HEXA|nr:unnamed protein product [Allacma fusca]
MLDTDGAIQQDFQLCYPLVSDNLSSKWSEVCIKIVSHFTAMKKTLHQFGISDGDYIGDEIGFFMLPALLRTKLRKVTVVDSARSFIEVVNPLLDIDQLATASDST